MSELEHVLKLFDFLNIDDVTTDNLKRAFKKKVLQVHPDKGGDPTEFDEALAGFLYLSDTFQRINGGRRTLQDILTPDELKNMRPDELIERVFEEFDLNKFNKQFEESHKATGHGYKDWLEKDDEGAFINGEIYGSITIKPPTFNMEDFNKNFENSIKKEKVEVNTIILHPEAMAYTSGQMLGTEIIESDEKCYTSNLFSKPEYTDVFVAFTSENIISNKVIEFSENNCKSYEDIVSERTQQIKPLDDEELKGIMEFEKKKLEENSKHFSRIKEHFEYKGTVGAQIENWPPSKYSNEEYSGFVRTF